MKFQPVEIIKSFDEYLADQGLEFEATVIGGTALSLLGQIDRTTRDVDLLSTPIPPIILKHAAAFAATKGLSPKWLNDGPETLRRDLPPNWESKLQILFKGDALTLWTLDRHCLLITKLYAAVSRSADDLDDLLRMKPTAVELEPVGEWVSKLDGNPEWPTSVENAVQKILGLLNAK